MSSKPSRSQVTGQALKGLPLILTSCLLYTASSHATYFPELLYEGYETSYSYQDAQGDPSAPSSFTQINDVGLIGNQGRVVSPGFKGNISLNVTQPLMTDDGSAVKLWNRAAWDYNYNIDNGFQWVTGSYNESTEEITAGPVRSSLPGIAMYGANQIYWLPEDSELMPIGSMGVRGGAGSNISEIIPEQATIGQEYSFYSSESIEYTTSAELLQAFDVGLDVGTYIETRGQHDYLVKVIYLGVDRLDNFRVNEPLPPSPDVWALVRAVEMTLVSDESTTTYFPNGQKQPYNFGKNASSTTTLEWRVNGIGLVKGMVLDGAYAQAIHQKSYFPTTVDSEWNVSAGQTTFEDSVYAQLQLYSFERTGGSKELNLSEVPDPVIDSQGRINLLQPFSGDIIGGGGSGGGGNTGNDTNAYDPNSNRLHLKVNAGSIGTLSLSMQIDDVARGIIHVLPETIAVLSSAPTDIATFNESTGQLFIPALKANGQTIYSNMTFELTNASTLHFRLKSYQIPQ